MSQISLLWVFLTKVVEPLAPVTKVLATEEDVAPTTKTGPLTTSLVASSPTANVAWQSEPIPRFSCAEGPCFYFALYCIR